MLGKLYKLEQKCLLTMWASDLKHLNITVNTNFCLCGTSFVLKKHT